MRQDNPTEPRNSPFAIIGVLALVLGIVGSLALAGRIVRAVPGTAAPAPVDAAAVLESPGASPLLADGVALPATTCALPPFETSPQRLREFYEATLGCLDRAWQPVLERAGAEFDGAGVDIAPDARSECGDAPAIEEATAFYCTADEVIYLPRTRLVADAGTAPSAHLAVLAHEYGHHVQHLSGLLLGSEAGEGTAEANEVIRRTELQANCFAGLFLGSVAGRGSVSGELARAATEEFRNTVASDTHGTSEHQLRWARHGYEAGTTAACNTWLAPAADVA